MVGFSDIYIYIGHRAPRVGIGFIALMWYVYIYRVRLVYILV